jgi:transcriptional regulator with XRE-family HTH domain
MAKMWRREDVIEKLRKDQGTRSLREYADVVGCSASLISQVYSGTREPSEELLDRLNLERETITVYKSKRRWR